MKHAAKHKNFFVVISTYIIIFIVLMLSLISFLFFINYDNFVLSLLYSYSKSNLSQTSYIADSMLESIYTIFNQLSFNSSASLLMYSAKEGDNYTLDALNWLSSYVNTNNNLESIYIYNARQSKVSYGIKNMGSGIESQNDFFDKQFISDISSGKISRTLPIVRITGKLASFPSASHKAVYSFVFVNNKNNSTSPDGAIIINFSEDSFHNILSYLNKSKNQAAFILDNNGVVISNNSAFPFLQKISDRAFVKQIKNSNSDSGYFISNINDSKSFVTFVQSNKSNWKFVSIVPYSSVTSPLHKIRLIFVFIYLIILLIGISVSIFISKQLNKPYNIMSDKIDNLEKQSRSSSNYLKQKFLHDFLYNSDSFSRSTALQKFEQFNIKLSLDKPFSMIMFKIDSYDHFCAEYNFRDRNLYKFAITNIASEICSKHCTNETVIFEDHIVMLVNCNESNLLFNIAQEICKLILKHLEISCSAVISSSISLPENINNLYNEISAASYYRMFFGHKSIFFSSEVLAREESVYIYPEKKVKQLLNSIMLGKLLDSKQIYLEIVSDLEKCNYNTFIQTIMRFAFEFSNTICTLEKNSNFSRIFNLNSFISEFPHFETIEDVNSIFFKAFNAIASSNDGKKEREHDDIVKNVKQIVNQEYGDQNLSLNEIADKVKVSSSFLRHLFKSSTNQSLSDYINIVRIEKAKGLLKTTSLSISDISDQIGFINSSYFFTVFKKMNGVTPNEFRRSKVLYGGPSLGSEQTDEGLTICHHR